MSSMETDAELVGRIHSDPRALEELYRRYVDRVTGYATARCRQPADVADLVGATFLTLLDSASSYDPAKGDVLPWIIGIAGRLHANRSRRSRREMRAFFRVGPKLELTDEDMSALEERIDAARQAPLVEFAISQLRPPHREALELVAHDGLSTSDAAAALGISEPTLRKRLSRARAALRKHLGHETNRTSSSLLEEVSP